MAAPQLFIQDDVCCLSCGYNLRGLMPNSKCPECGDSVRAALRMKWLGEPANRLRYRQGIAMQVTAISMLSLCVLPLVALASFLATRSNGFALICGLFLIVAATIAGAIFVGTVPVPGVQKVSLRVPLRLLAVSNWMLLASVIASHFSPLRLPLVPQDRYWQLVCLSSTATLLLWSIEVFPTTRLLEVSALHATRGLGYITITLLSLLFVLLMVPDATMTFCVGIVVPFCAMASGTAYFWSVGRELWS